MNLCVRRWITAILGAMLLQLGCQRTTSGVATVTLGAIAPLTGQGAEYGKWAQRGVDLALEEINKPGAAIRFKVVWEDSQLSPTTAVSAFLKLVDSDKVPLVLGPLTSGETIPCVPKANERHVVVLSPTATSDKLVDAGQYFFRVCPTNHVQADAAARFCRDTLKANSAYVLYEEIAYGADLAGAFTEEFQALGGRISARDSFREGTTEYRPAVQKIRAANPDVVYFPSNYTEAGTFLRQMAQLGVRQKVIGGDGSYGQELLDIAGPSADGTYWTTIAWGTGEDKTIAESFRTRYRTAYGEAPHQFAGLYYDGARIAFQAITRADMRGQDVRQALLDLPPFHGATGTTKFSANGQVAKSFAVYVVKGGGFEQIEP
jgi:branched-chain amino acid transport system substrate-binding protein